MIKNSKSLTESSASKEWRWGTAVMPEGGDRQQVPTMTLILVYFLSWFEMSFDESENNLGSSLPLMTIKVSVTHLLRALIMKCNGWSNGNKWAVHLRAPIDNILVVEYKYRNSLFIKARNNYKKNQNPKIHTNTDPKVTPSHFLSKQTFSLSNLSIRVFLANTTPVCSISF